MDTNIFKSLRILVFLVLLLPGIFPNCALATVSSNTVADFTSVPVNLTNTDVTPMVMVNSSHDHQLYFKAYNDYSDLDNDGQAETTYKHSIDYYGYFDSYKCYTYNSTWTHASGNGRFEPVSETTDKYCSGQWSGNFLNWATMTRIDTIRKLLFGGHRRVDTKDPLEGTVLERAFLPPDIHSFAKYYNGEYIDGTYTNDVNKLTPYANTTPPTGTSSTNSTIPGLPTSSTSMVPGTGSKTFTVNAANLLIINDVVMVRSSSKPGNTMKGTITAINTTTPSVTVNVTSKTGSETKNDWQLFPSRTLTTTFTGNHVKLGDFINIVDHANSANYLKGWVTDFDSATGDLTIEVNATAGVGNSSMAWDITNLTRNGITICNTTFKSGLTSELSHKQAVIDTPPLIRVALGNYAFWSAGETNQCLWEGEDGDNVFRGGHGANWNNPVLSEIPAGQDRPYKADVGVADGSGALLGDFIARVKVCDPALLGQERCKLYPHGNYKPIGLLQTYGDDNQMMFGMIDGTYGKPRKGGDLVAKIFNNTGGNGMCREINVGIDCNNDGVVDGNDDLDDTGTANLHTIGDGTFKLVWKDAGGPITSPATKPEGLINAWSLYRIYGYKYGDWNYNDNSQGDKCPLGVNFFGIAGENECSNWGNPFSEIYLTSMRYFSGYNAPQDYQSNDGAYITGLNYGSGNWKDPITDANRCARLSVINFNSSISSMDTFYSSDSGSDDLDSSNQGLQHDWNSPKTSKEITDTIGIAEGISADGKTWFIGENGIDNNHRCTAKAVPNFGNARGLCPEGPDLRGGFRIAGLAYYAHTEDLRATGVTARTGTQNIDTYAVKLATGAPVIDIPVPGSATGQKVTLMPSCIDNDKSDYGCTMVDFKIIQPHTVANGVGTGKFLVIWEDSLQGNDYDLDAGGTISYTIDANQITITTAITLQNLGHKIGSGYVISGTTQDGLHIHSGTNGFNYTDSTAISGCTGCTIANGPSTRTYTIGGTGASQLEDPLWYAAKWGGFIDSDGDNTPNLQSEWDRIHNNDGTDGPDGIPDNYFFATNPIQLEKSLNRVFLAILQRTSSGTAAAVVSTNVSGVGALYQAFYEPLRKDALGNNATWLGTLQALWLDSYGYLRENDTLEADGSVHLDGYNTDKVIQLFYDEAENKTRVRRYTSTKDTEFAPFYMKGTVTGYNSATGSVTFTVEEISGSAGSGPFSEWTVYNLTTGNTSDSTSSASIIPVGGSPPTFSVFPAIPFAVDETIMVAHFQSEIIELTDVGTLWNARKQLSFDATDAAATNVTTQRPYSNKADGSATGGRFIKTWIDTDRDSVVDTSPTNEVIDFTSASIVNANYGFFNVATKAEAQKVVDYIRGKEVTGYRNRTVDYDSTGTPKVMRLGDIVGSTPTAVNAPQENFDLLYKDETYTAFKQKYAKRRQVVYVGSNGGMLHAFNGGFYDSTQQAFLPQGKKNDGVTDATEHPLGAEIWAYVPMNLLPHLKWLTSNDYTHVYYVDGKPKVFDAKIFTDTTKYNADDHPGGWGTVMVVGMRFGGGKMIVDTAANGFNNSHADDRVFSSAYVIMDITNPEAEPTVLAEIQVPDTSSKTAYTSFSTSYPAIMAVKDKVPASDANKWYLTFGAGPDNIRSGSTYSRTGLASAKSTTTAKFYVFDLGEIATPGSSAAGAPVTDNVVTCTRNGIGTAGTMKILACDTKVASSFIGDPIAVDWDLDYKVDSLYFGTVGDKTATSGKVMRFAINESDNPVSWTVPKTLIDAKMPVVAGVTPGVDETGKKWIFFGTGRFFVGDDQTSTATQAIYAVKENADGSEVQNPLVDPLSLINVSNAQVDTDGNLTGVTGSAGTVTTLNALRTEIKDHYKGWYLNLPPIKGVAGTAPATRVINQSGLAGGVLFTTAYQPGVDACVGEGFSRLYGLYYKSGTAYPDPTVFGTEIVNGVQIAKAFIELGYGFATSPSLHIGSGSGDEAVSVFTQLSTGAIVRTEASTVLGVRSGISSWKEQK